MDRNEVKLNMALTEPIHQQLYGLLLVETDIK